MEDVYDQFCHISLHTCNSGGGRTPAEMIDSHSEGIHFVPAQTTFQGQGPAEAAGGGGPPPPPGGGPLPAAAPAPVKPTPPKPSRATRCAPPARRVIIFLNLVKQNNEYAARNAWHCASPRKRSDQQ